ncbi:MAG: GTP-binding protein [Pirellulales bacterium]
MKRLRYVMIGGFLGAGKTTLIGRLAKTYADQGLRVGIVTNDQAHGLVDTLSLRAQGFDVGEVTGACFCCKFNDLVRVVGELSSTERPDVVLAEPVGSCTDLAATVMEPLKHLYSAEVELAPLAVLLKPEHGEKILGDAADVGFSSKAAYIFRKQLEEADLVVVNKIDKLAPERAGRLVEMLKEQYPGKATLSISARTGAGVDALAKQLLEPAQTRLSTPEMDYDVYAEGEAELGWLNCTVKVAAPAATAVDAALLDFVKRLADACREAGAEPAHLKVLASADDVSAVANWVCSDVPPELSIASGAAEQNYEFVVNARVAVALRISMPPSVVRPPSLPSPIRRGAKSSTCKASGPVDRCPRIACLSGTHSARVNSRHAPAVTLLREAALESHHRARAKKSRRRFARREFASGCGLGLRTLHRSSRPHVGWRGCRRRRRFPAARGRVAETRSGQRPAPLPSQCRVLVGSSGSSNPGWLGAAPDRFR